MRAAPIGPTDPSEATRRPAQPRVGQHESPACAKPAANAAKGNPALTTTTPRQALRFNSARPGVIMRRSVPMTDRGGLSRGCENVVAAVGVGHPGVAKGLTHQIIIADEAVGH